MTKKNFLYTIGLLLFAVLFGNSCSKNNDQFFEVRLDFDLDLPAGLNSLETHYFIYRDVPNFYTQSLIANGITNERVKNITGSKAILRGTTGQVSFELFRAIRIFAVQRNNPSNRLEMFYLEQIPFNQGFEMELLTSISNLKSILESDDLYTLEFQIEFRTFIPINQRIRLNYGYAVFYE